MTGRVEKMTNLGPYALVNPRPEKFGPEVGIVSDSANVLWESASSTGLIAANGSTAVSAVQLLVGS